MGVELCHCLKESLFTENSHAGQAEAGAGASPAIRSPFEFLLVFLFVLHFELLFEALKASFVTFESLKYHFVFPKFPSPSATSRRGPPRGSAGSRRVPQVPDLSATPQGTADSGRVPKSLCLVADFSGTPVLLNNIQVHSCLQLHHFAPC